MRGATGSLRAKLILFSTTILLGCGERAAFQSVSASSGDNPVEADATASGGTAPDGTATVDNAPGESTVVDTNSDANGNPLPNTDTDANGNGLPSDSDVDIDQLEKLCQGSGVKSFTQDIVFPKPQTTCDWGKNGNQPFSLQNQLIITARREETAPLAIPSGALLCSISFEFPSQRMRYDDEIMLAYNQVILAASQAYDQKDELETKDGFLLYDWSRIVGDQYPIDSREGYFIDDDCTDCYIPETEQTGTMKLSVKPATMKKIAVATSKPGFVKSKSHALMFITTGDNDQSQDCMHEDFQFMVGGSYVMP